jgi:hypothetical protein
MSASVSMRTTGPGMSRGGPFPLVVLPSCATPYELVLGRVVSFWCLVRTLSLHTRARVASRQQWRSPITWAGGGNIPPNRPADYANLAPAGSRDSPLWRSTGCALIRSPAGTAALLRLGYPGDLLSGERLLLFFSRFRVTREPPGALAERSGSERKPEQAAARPGRVGPA